MTEPAASTPDSPRFRDLALIEPLLRALDEVGYESPSPIQAACIPVLLEGRDVLGQAQTGTGKTAAFALPVISRLNLLNYVPQALVLTPTRELAIQVAEAFQRYARHLERFHVLPIYGGQAYGAQLGGLRRGVHVVVGTPGRVIDHMERGTLNLSALTTLVLDEADEMLRMGFIDDVEKILAKTPPQRQVALFSATMPAPIRRIAQTYMKSPAEITIKSKTTTATNIRQRYWTVVGTNKLDALTRILEAEPFDGMLIFCRTKQATSELAEKLEARGFAVAPLNGDIDQKTRERTVARLKKGEIDIIVATDVAARGLDVERVSHVINYDVPTDAESYTHRIGRTGRAGRSGDAILFIAPRERNMLRVIERATRQPITPMELPSADAANDRRVAKFKQSITETLADPAHADKLAQLRTLIEQVEREHGVPALDVASALALVAYANSPLLKHLQSGGSTGAAPAAGSATPSRPAPRPAAPAQSPYHDMGGPVAASSPEPSARERPRSAPPARFDRPASETPQRPRVTAAEPGMETYRIEVGHQHGVKPGNIVGAIANEAELDSQYIGRVQIFDDHSLVDLPADMPRATFEQLQNVWVVSQRMRISKVSGGGAAGAAPPRKHEPRTDFGKGREGRPLRLGDKPPPRGASFKTRADRPSAGGKPSGRDRPLLDLEGRPVRPDKPGYRAGKFNKKPFSKKPR
jgi:ATP-dependent RNA helicase DeaD